jgi:hypothetical protein
MRLQLARRPCYSGWTSSRQGQWSLSRSEAAVRCQWSRQPSFPRG